MAAAKPGAAMTSDGVDFVDENYARCILFSLDEQIADPGSTDTDEHFNEV